jgi:predicted nucleotidyltransferase
MDDPRIAELVRRIVLFLRPRRVILFGSRARGDHVEKSDIDLAIAEAESPLRGWHELMNSLHADPVTLLAVDLVSLEEVDDGFRARVEREGRVMYERRAA